MSDETGWISVPMNMTEGGLTKRRGGKQKDSIHLVSISVPGSRLRVEETWDRKR